MKNLAFDLGGHHGESLLFLKDYLSDPSEWDIISIEASPLNYIKLKKTANDLQDVFKKIKTINAFAYHLNRGVEFFEYVDSPYDDGSTYSKYKVNLVTPKKPADLRYNVITVPTYNIVTAYIENLMKYDNILIKMDIEGAEYEILPELIKNLSPIKTPIILGEFHNVKVNVSPSVDDKIIKDLRDIDIEFKVIDNLIYRKHDN